MKKLITICLLMTATIAANAQKSVTQGTLYKEARTWNVIDKYKNEETWSYTVDWSKVTNISIRSVTCLKDKCKKTLSLNISGEGYSFVACVYFLEKDSEKMQAIIDSI